MKFWYSLLLQRVDKNIQQYIARYKILYKEAFHIYKHIEYLKILS